MRFASRLAAALAAAAALSGFTFVRHHITEAPVVDDTIPFYGSGLMIGPAETLPGVIKRAPFKFRANEFLPLICVDSCRSTRVRVTARRVATRC